jgi:hypothetical protein
MKSMSGGSFSPIPKAMIDMLAKMTLEEEASAAATKRTTENTEESNKTGIEQNTPRGNANGQDYQTPINSQKHP